MRRFFAFLFLVGALFAESTSNSIMYAVIAIALYVSKNTEEAR
jgi:hypothetical protein